MEEEDYFFKLSAYPGEAAFGLIYIRVPDFMLPKERLNEVASFT